MIQSSIHNLSDCSFSPLCPAVLPCCHSGSNERSDSHGWYSHCYYAFIGNRYVCCFVICSESKNRAPRDLIACPYSDLDEYWISSPAGQLQGSCRVPMGPTTQMKKLYAFVRHTQYYFSDTIHALLSFLCQVN